MISRRNRRRCILHTLRGFVLVWMTGILLCVYYTEVIDRNREPVKSTIDTCSKDVHFNESFIANLDKLKIDIYNKSLPWIQKLGLDRRRERVRGPFPVFVTAVSRSFFVRSQGLIKSIVEKLLPTYKNMKFIYYDLDLDRQQADIIRRYCQCEVRRLPVDKLPSHIQKYQNYAFKPVIVNLVYEEFGNVWWLDSSVRFISRDLQLPLKYLKEKGMLFFTYDATSSIASHTDRRMFTYFNEDPCLYLNFGEIEASNIAFNNHPVSRDVLRLWLSCALDQTCIAPENVTKRCSITPNVTTTVIGRCHRFDQSAISIILRRLYHKQNHYPLVETPYNFLEIRRKGDIPFYGKL